MKLPFPALKQKTRFRKYCLVLLALAAHWATPAAAQLKDCNAFIQGNYLELGINYNGAYGSAAEVPAGYHNRGGSILAPNAPGCAVAASPTQTLGFVADPDRDGWSAGTPAFYGDFFTPGNPQEGWSIMTEKMEQVNCWNALDSGKYAGGMSGSNTRHLVSGSRIAAEWEGIYDSLQIIQRTILDKTGTYFVIRVKIRNLAHRSRKDIYYLRTLDPDNDQTLPSGRFETDNRISYQNPNADSLSIITATGCTYPGAYLSLGAKDLRAKCFITRGLVHGSTGLERLFPSVRIDSLHAAADTLHLYAAGDSLLNRDVSVGLVFKIDSLPAADSTILKIAYMFGGKSDIPKAMKDDGLLPDERTPTGIRTAVLPAQISVSPNPFDQLLQIEGSNASDRISICDFQSTTIACDIQANGKGHLLNTSFLATGIYILTVTDAQGQVQHRQLIQHR